MFRMVLTMVMAGALALAQNGPSSEAREQMMQRVAAMAERLQLTPEQKQQIEPILREEMTQLRAVRQEMGDPQSASLRTKRKMAQKVKSIREESEKKMKPILTPQQMSELKKIREENKEQMRERMRQR